MPHRALGFLTIVLLVVVLAPASMATTTSEFTLQATPAVDVPDRTTTFDGTEYTITAIGRVTPGEDIDVTVTAPTDATYNVYLYNNDKDIVDFTSRTGDASIAFPTNGLAAGSYTIVLEQDGQFERIHPVVISGYQVDMAAPSSATQPDAMNVTVSLTTLDGGSIDRVEAVIANADGETRTTLDATGDQTYAGTIQTTTLTPGTYQLYAVVRGTETISGANELLGLSDAPALQIHPEQTTTTTTTTTTSEDNGASGPSPDSTTTATTPTPTTITTETPTATTSNTTSTPPDTGATTDPGRPSTTTVASTSQQTPTTETDTPNVITPNKPTTAGPGTTATAGLPFGVFRLVILGVFAFFISRLVHQ